MKMANMYCINSQFDFWMCLKKVGGDVLRKRNIHYGFN